MNLKGINIRIGAETTGLDKALSEVNRRARETQVELRQVERLLKLDPKNTELLAQKQKLLAQATENTRAKLAALKAAQSQVEAQFKRGDIGEKQYRAFNREIVKTESELKRLQSTGKKTSVGFVEGAKAMWGELTVVGATLAGIGVAALDLIKTYANSEKSEIRLRAAVEATGKSYDSQAAAIDNAISRGMAKAFDDEEQIDAMARLIQMTQDRAEAEKLLTIAMDVTRGTPGADLIKTSVMLGKVYNGNTAAAKKFGITIDKNATSMEVLAEVERRYAGQADAYVDSTQGKIDRLMVSLDNLKESGGAALVNAGAIGNIDMLSASLNYFSDTTNEAALKQWQLVGARYALDYNLEKGLITQDQYNDKLAELGLANDSADKSTADLAASQKDLANATDDTTEAWAAQKLELTAGQNNRRSVIQNVLALRDAQRNLADYLKGGGKKSGAEYYDLLGKQKDAMALLKLQTAEMTDKQIDAAVKQGIISKKFGESRKHANEAADAIDRFNRKAKGIPDGKVFKLKVVASGGGTLRAVLDGQLTRFVVNAQGGMYNTPTYALIGETREREYVINAARLARGDARQKALLSGLLKDGRMSLGNPRQYLDKGTAGASALASSTSSRVVNVNNDFRGTVVREDADITKIAEQIAQKQQSADRAAGIGG
ncbi:MAG: hypothetical protein HGB10_00305 [Coriobacteriia bacterium]|nr:hypothetical protein [Coriobacteriia bacterium]